jgi:formylglycine-generating enzyme required for sulfatase activity
MAGTKAANELGIYDMSGNVFELCSDWYDSTYPTGTNNPAGATSGSYHVIRGGSWYYGASYCTVFHRYYDTPVSRNSNLGFRVVLVP